MVTTLDPVLDPEKEYEIVNGQPEEKVTGGARHGGVGMRLGARLVMHVEAHRLGGIYGPDTTFQIGANERLPDISFVAAERIPPEGKPEGKWPMAPDLAVEIILPGDLFEEVISKVKDYFAGGVRQAWLISPEHKTVIIHHSPTQTTILSEEDEPISEDLLPGFRCRISELFQPPGRVDFS